MSKYDPSKFDPFDPSTYPGPDDVSPFGIKIQTPYGMGFEINADPTIPGDADAALAYTKQLLQEKAVVKALSPLLATSSIPAPPTAQSITLSKAIDAWKANFAQRNKNTKTQSSYLSALNRFLAFTGDKIVSTLLDTHVIKYRDDRKAQGKALSTVDGDTKALSDFFKWAKRNKYYPNTDLPTEGLCELKKSERESVAEGAERFTLDELIRIFTASVYKKHNTRPHEYWLPLLALFTGARIEELCQLHLTDIYRDGDILILDLNDLGKKTLKTKASKRKVPIHSQLIDLGFADYLADVKNAFPDATMLFPYLTPTKHGRLSDRASKAWGRYLNAINIHGRDKVFHSFRDTANNELADRGVTIELRCALVGHDINNVNVTKYRDPIPPARLLKEGIALMKYERIDANGTVTALDLSLLKYYKGQFVQRLKQCAEEEEKSQAVQAKKKANAQLRKERAEQLAKRPGRPVNNKTEGNGNA